jgi:hypothetical protein
LEFHSHSDNNNENYCYTFPHFGISEFSCFIFFICGFYLLGHRETSRFPGDESSHMETYHFDIFIIRTFSSILHDGGDDDDALPADICARQAEQLNPARDDLICLGGHFQIVSCRRPDMMTTCGMIYRNKQDVRPFLSI